MNEEEKIIREINDLDSEQEITKKEILTHCFKHFPETTMSFVTHILGNEFTTERILEIFDFLICASGDDYADSMECLTIDQEKILIQFQKEEIDVFECLKEIAILQRKKDKNDRIKQECYNLDYYLVSIKKLRFKDME